MTLIVSLRIPDGIVIAADSLSTLMAGGQFETTFDVTCPSCNHQHEIQSKSPIFPLPGATFSYAQKVFPFLGKFGIGIFGAGLIANKSVYFIMRLLQQKLESISSEGVTAIAQNIGDKIQNLCEQQLKRENIDIDVLPDNQAVLGFQIVGYDDIEPKTVEILVGKNMKYQVMDQLGCTVSGSREVVQAIWELYERNPESQPPYPVFSLQDAIDYAEFLIRTTIAHQRFAQTIPNVGGDIDIALVTPFDGFQWIRQKSLGKILEGK